MKWKFFAVALFFSTVIFVFFASVKETFAACTLQSIWGNGCSCSNPQTSCYVTGNQACFTDKCNGIGCSYYCYQCYTGPEAHDMCGGGPPPSCTPDQTGNPNNCTSATYSGGACLVPTKNDYSWATGTPTRNSNYWTLSAWVYPTSLSNDQQVVLFNGMETDAWGSTNNHGYGMLIWGTRLYAIAPYASTYLADSGYDFPSPNQWYHVVITNPGQTTFYVNGQEKNTAYLGPIVGIYDNFDRFTIGGNWNRDGNGFLRTYTGRIDEVGVWTRVLNRGEINSLAGGDYYGKSGSSFRNASLNNQLVGYWNMDETSGVYIHDSVIGYYAAAPGSPYVADYLTLLAYNSPELNWGGYDSPPTPGLPGPLQITGKTNTSWGFNQSNDTQCSDSCGTTFSCGPSCTNLAPGPVSLSSPSDGATSIPVTTVVQAAYNAATFNWGRNCSGNTNTFTFYLDTNTNPTTLRCTNTASPANSTNISSGCQVSNLAYTTRYYWKVVASNGSQTATSPIWSFTTTNPSPWWQVKDADVVTNGNLTSSIPSSCSLPGCNPIFDISGTGGYPGVPLYVGSYDFNAGAGTGNVSAYPSGTVGWNANTQTSFKKVYDYSFFKNTIPSDVQASVVEITTPSVNGGFFNSGGTPARGYVWYHFNGATYGDLTINGNLNLVGTRKVVLLVEGANLNIVGKMNIQSSGQGFFMAVVGKDANGQKGNIAIDPTVSSPNSPAVEGIYFADGNVSTGAGNNWLYVRGAVAAMGGITLQRNLTNNSNQPAEYFEYAPDLALLYPGVFKTRPIKWKEVAP